MSFADAAPGIGQGTSDGFTANGARADECVRLLRLGVDLGLTLIDTAPVYEGGHAEIATGRAVAESGGRAYVATKIPPEDAAPEAVVRTVEQSLRRLAVDCIDLLQIHWPHPTVPLEDTLGAMSDLVGRGLVRWLGLGNATPAQVKRALASPAHIHLVSLQQEYSLLDRSAELELLPLCRAHGLTLIAYSPLGRGRLASDDGRRAVLEEIARRNGATAGQIVLAWLRREPGAVVPIPKAARESHLRENAAAARLVVDASDLARIDEVFAMRVEELPTDAIVVRPEPGEPGLAVYTTVEEALANPLGLVPGPAELAERIAAGEMLKPVKVRRLDAHGEAGRYRLVDGRVRYWAWVIAHRGRTPIPALVEG